MKPHKQKATNANSPTPAGANRQIVIWVMVLAVIIALALIINRKKESSRGEPVSSSSPTQPSISTNSPAPLSQALPELQKLKGKWLRPDGGYIIEIRSADSNGKLDASYLNPKSIHVAKAEAKQEGGALKVFIELQDVNYPGSTYTLTYLPDRDLLAGVYFQALQRQSFEVYFERTQ